MTHVHQAKQQVHSGIVKNVLGRQKKGLVNGHISFVIEKPTGKETKVSLPDSKLSICFGFNSYRSMCPVAFFRNVQKSIFPFAQ